MTTVYMAYWEGSFSMSPSPEDEHLFRNIGNMALATDAEERFVFIVPDLDGSCPEELERERNGGLGIRYRWHIGEQPWARFMRHETEIILADDGSVLWDVPTDHELAWPKITTRGVIDDGMIAVREFTLRIRSAYLEAGLDGMKEVVRGTPETVKRLMPREVWANIIADTMAGKELTQWT